MSDLKTKVRIDVQAAAQNALQTTTDDFAVAVQADMRRERRLLYAELIILALLLGLVGLRFWMAR